MCAKWLSCHHVAPYFYCHLWMKLSFTMNINNYCHVWRKKEKQLDTYILDQPCIIQPGACQPSANMTWFLEIAFVWKVVCVCVCVCVCVSV